MYKFTRRQGAIHGDAQRAASVGLIEPPAWLPYMDLHPPPAPALSLGRGKHKIEYKEEVIAKTWLRLHPELQAVPLRKFMGDSRWYKPVVSYWAEKQLRFMDQGYSKKQAFKLAHEEFLANRAQRALEVELVRLQALQMGIPAKPDVNPLFQMNRDLAKKLMFELEQSEQNKEVERLEEFMRQFKEHRLPVLLRQKDYWEETEENEENREILWALRKELKQTEDAIFREILKQRLKSGTSLKQVERIVGQYRGIRDREKQRQEQQEIFLSNLNHAKSHAEVNDIVFKRKTQLQDQKETLQFLIEDAKPSELLDYLKAEMETLNKIEEDEALFEEMCTEDAPLSEFREEVHRIRFTQTVQKLDRGEEEVYQLNGLGLGKNAPTVSSKDWPITEFSLTAADMVVPDSSEFFPDIVSYARSSDTSVDTGFTEEEFDDPAEYLVATTGSLVEELLDKVEEAKEKLRALTGEAEPELENDPLDDEDPEQSEALVGEEGEKGEEGEQELMEEEEGPQETQQQEDQEQDEEDEDFFEVHGIETFDGFKAQTVLLYLQRHPEDRMLFAKWDPIEHAELEYDLQNIDRQSLDLAGSGRIRSGPPGRFGEPPEPDTEESLRMKEILTQQDKAAFLANRRDPNNRPRALTTSQRTHVAVSEHIEQTVKQNEKLLKSAGFGDLLDSIEDKYAFLPNRMKRNLDFKRTKEDLQKRQLELLEKLRQVGKENGVDVEDTLLQFERQVQTVLKESDQPLFDDRLQQLTGHSTRTTATYVDKLLNTLTEDLVQSKPLPQSKQ